MIKHNFQTNPKFFELVLILGNDDSSHELIAILPPWLSKHYVDGKVSLLDGILHFKERHSRIIVLYGQDQIISLMKECHDNIGAEHFYEERTIERVKTLLGGKIGILK